MEIRFLMKKSEKKDKRIISILNKKICDIIQWL